MTSRNPFQDSRYLLSVHQLEQLPPDEGLEVVIAGRSNAGKSSAINVLAGQTRLARTSRTPGRTQQLVYFQVRPGRFLVDLPGYGYARVSQSLQQHWKQLMEVFLRKRASLAGLILVMDVRHPLRDFDRQLLDFAQMRGLPCHILLTKADKLPHGQRSRTLQQVRSEVGSFASVQLFSSLKRTGLEEAREVLSQWLALDHDNAG